MTAKSVHAARPARVSVTVSALGAVGALVAGSVVTSGTARAATATTKPTPATTKPTPATTKPATKPTTTGKPVTTKAGTRTTTTVRSSRSTPGGVSATPTTRPAKVLITPVAPPTPTKATVASAQTAVDAARRKGDIAALVKALRDLGLRYLEAKRPAEAVPPLREAVSLLTRPADAIDRRDTEATLGWALNTAGDFTGGVTVLLDALKLADAQRATTPVVVNILKLLVWGTRASADHTTAVRALERLRDLGEAGETTVDLGDTYEGLAVERLLSKQPATSAVSDARKAVALRATAKPAVLAGSYQVLGWALDTADVPADAVGALKKSIELRKTAGMPAADNLEALLLLANAARKAGDADTSLGARREVIQIARDRNDVVALADGLDELGLAALLLGRPASAVAPLTESVALRRKGGASVAFGRSLHLLGWALSGVNRLDDAIQAYNEAAEIRRQVNDVREAQLESLRALGYTLWTAKRGAEAIPAFEKSLALVRRDPVDPAAEAGALTDVAFAYLIGGQPEKAVQPAQASMSAFERLGTTKGEPYAAALYAYAWALFSNGKQGDAIEPFRKSLAIREAIGSEKVAETRNFLQAAIEASRSGS